MIYISNLIKIQDNKYSIGYTHHKPFDEVYGLNKSKEELLKDGVLIESIPSEEYKEGFYSELFYNPIENTCFYEYNKIPEKPKELTIEDLKSQLDAQDLAIAELTALINK